MNLTYCQIRFDGTTVLVCKGKFRHDGLQLKSEQAGARTMQQQKTLTSQTLGTYEQVQNLKQDLYCVIPSNRITTEMRCIFWNSLKTNKSTRQ